MLFWSSLSGGCASSFFVMRTLNAGSLSGTASSSEGNLVRLCGISHVRMEERRESLKQSLKSALLFWFGRTTRWRDTCVTWFSRGGKGGQCWPSESPGVALVAKDAFYLIPPLIFFLLFIFFNLFCVSPANQPHSKVCMHAYLFPFPVSHQTHNATEYESAISKFLRFTSHTSLGSGSCDSAGWPSHCLQSTGASGASSCWLAWWPWCSPASSSSALPRSPATACIKQEAASSWHQVRLLKYVRYVRYIFFPLLVSKHRCWRAVTS